MNRRGDDGSEMPRHDPFDDAAIDRLLSGRAGAESGDLASFVEDARTAAEAVPAPSHALASALATGILPVPAPVPQSLWRKSKMKIQGLLAGMSIAGKIALGVGVAAAATTGAGAAGVLPGPVQHAVANAVGSVTPFEFPDGGSHDGGNVTEPPVEVTTTTSDHHEVTPTTEHETPTTEKHTESTTTEPHESTPTTEHHESPPTTEFVPTPPTTEHHETPTTEQHDTPTTEHHDGDTTTTVAGEPATLTLSCAQVEHHVHCTWSTSNDPDHHVYKLIRHSTVVWSTETGTSYDDTPEVGTFNYYIISYRNDGSIDSEGSVSGVVFTG